MLSCFKSCNSENEIEYPDEFERRVNIYRLDPLLLLSPIKFSYVWQLQNFKTCMKSEAISLQNFQPYGDGRKWGCLLTLKNVNNNKKYFGLHLYYGTPHNEVVLATYEISILDNRGNRRFSTESTNPVKFHNDIARGNKYIVERNILKNLFADIFGVNDTLFISCDVTIHGYSSYV